MTSFAFRPATKYGGIYEDRSKFVLILADVRDFRRFRGTLGKKTRRRRDRSRPRDNSRLPTALRWPTALRRSRRITLAGVRFATLGLRETLIVRMANWLRQKDATVISKSIPTSSRDQLFGSTQGSQGSRIAGCPRHHTPVGRDGTRSRKLGASSGIPEGGRRSGADAALGRSRTDAEFPYDQLPPDHADSLKQLHGCFS